MNHRKTPKKPDPISIFVAYSRKDEVYLQKLRKHLRPLERRGEVKIWYDGDIEVGSNWDAMIKEHLHSADIILPLVSADALASDYFHDTEMRIALDRQANGVVEIIPIILKMCLWEYEPIGELQALPKDGKPIESWQRESEAYTSVLKGVKERIASLKELRKQNEKVQLWLKELLIEMTKKSYANAITLAERILELTPKDGLVQSLKIYLEKEEEQKNVVQEKLAKHEKQLRDFEIIQKEYEEKIKLQQVELRKCERQLKDSEKSFLKLRSLTTKYEEEIHAQQRELVHYKDELRNFQVIQSRDKNELGFQQKELAKCTEELKGFQRFKEGSEKSSDLKQDEKLSEQKESYIYRFSSWIVEDDSNMMGFVFLAIIFIYFIIKIMSTYKI